MHAARISPRSLTLSALLLTWLIGAPAGAKTIVVTPQDSYQKIEAAVAGDVVEIAPGTYKFRVNFASAGTAQSPIVVRAQDPNNRPVWDLTGIPVGSAPGSYTAGDRGRGCWQFRAGHYQIDGIVFKNCIDHSSAGIRVVNVPNIRVRNCLFVGNTNGVTGAGDGFVVEHSEFDRNGQALAGDQPAHQMYIYGGTFTMRYSYVHDSPAGQDFHLRARDVVLEYNWLTRPGSYMGDLMTCEYLCGGAAGQGITQRMLLRGNVIVQGMPANRSQLIALFKDAGGAVDGTGDVSKMELTLVHNTIIATPMPPFTHRVVNMRNDGVGTDVRVIGNVMVGWKNLYEAAAPTMTNWSVMGNANWFTTGTGGISGLQGTKTGADPMLGAGYVPAGGSPVINGATGAAGTLAPMYEYYRDEMTKLMGRARSTSNDIGAFENNTMSTPFGGGGGGMTTVDGGVSDAAGADLTSISTDAATAPPDLARDAAAISDIAVLENPDSGGAPGMQGGGCSCRASGSGDNSGAALLFAVLLALATAARHPRNPSPISRAP